MVTFSLLASGIQMSIWRLHQAASGWFLVYQHVDTLYTSLWEKHQLLPYSSYCKAGPQIAQLEEAEGTST